MANLKKWVIILTGKPGGTYYWTGSGWITQIEKASVFYTNEKKQIALPTGGKWHDITKSPC